MKGNVNLATTLLAASSLFVAGSALAQTPGGNPTPGQDRTRSELRQHQPGTGNPATQLKKQLRSRSKDGSQAGAAAAGAGAGFAGQGSGQNNGGKKYSPGDGSGNQGVGPRDGSGYGPGDCTQPNGGSGTQRRVGRVGRGRG